MKTTPMLVSLAVLLFASGSAAAQSTQEHKLSWLQGCWAVVSQEPSSSSPSSWPGAQPA